MSKILALDIGKRKTGVAITDPSGRVVFLKESLLAEKIHDLADSIRKILAEEKIETVIVGWPLQLNGTKGGLCEYIDELEEILDVTFIRIDERLSSKIAQREFEERDDDAMAAKIILETYLRRLEQSHNSG